MDVNRLAELKKAAGLPVQDDDNNSDDGKGGDVEMQPKSEQSKAIAEHMKEYETIKEDLATIRQNVALIEKLKDEERTTVNEKARKGIMKKLDGIMGETTAAGSRIKTQLDKISGANEKFKKDHPNSAITQMRNNLYQTHIRRFHQTMNSYNQASHDFRKALKDRTRRELAIVDNKLTPTQIDQIVESGNAQEVIESALISEDLDNVVQQIEERHQGIKKLEQQVIEVYELFRDLAQLVDLQQETLDVIENRVTLAKNYAEKAVEELNTAEEYQKKARKKMCCILFIGIGVLVAVLVPTLGSTVFNIF